MQVCFWICSGKQKEEKEKEGGKGDERSRSRNCAGNIQIIILIITKMRQHAADHAFAGEISYDIIDGMSSRILFYPFYKILQSAELC